MPYNNTPIVHPGGPISAEFPVSSTQWRDQRITVTIGERDCYFDSLELGPYLTPLGSIALLQTESPSGGNDEWYAYDSVALLHLEGFDPMDAGPIDLLEEQVLFSDRRQALRSSHFLGSGLALPCGLGQRIKSVTLSMTDLFKKPGLFEGMELPSPPMFISNNLDPVRVGAQHLAEAKQLFCPA